MSVNLSDYVSGKTNVRESAPVRGGTDASGVQNRGGQELSLKAGEQLRGTVIEADAGKVVIETKDHGVFTARLENGMQVNKGDVMEFEVRGMQGRQITLTPLYSNMSVDSSVWKALQAASLPVTDAHVRMVNEMMSQGMGIDRQSLHGMAGLISQYQTASPELLVQMRQLGIPITNESVMQAESYRNNTAQIVSGFGEIGEQVVGLMREMAADGEYEALGRLFTEAAKLFAEGTLSEGLIGSKVGVPDGSGIILGQTAENMDGMVRLIPGGNAAVNGVLDGSQELTADGKQNTGNGSTGAADSLEMGDPAAGEGTQKAEAGMSRLMADIRLTAGNSGADVPNGAEIRDPAAGDGTQKAADKTARLMADSKLAAGNGGVDAAASVETGSHTAGDPMQKVADGKQDLFSGFLKSLSDALAKQGETPLLYRSAGQELSRLLSEPQFGASLQNALIRKWLLSPQDTASKGQVQELYETVLRQTGQLKQMLADAGKQDSPAMKSIQNMERDVEFLNELNQNFAYVQLPLKMSGQNATGDLYVYTNKKGFAGSDGAVTAFLHLGMEHLGDMDIYVALKQQKVSTKFYLEDDSIIDFLEAHMEELDKRLSGKGYLVKSELLRKDHEDHGNVFDQMLKDSKSAGAAPQILLSRQSFDARA